MRRINTSRKGEVQIATISQEEGNKRRANPSLKGVEN